MYSLAFYTDCFMRRGMTMATVSVHCRYGASDKHGHARSSEARYRCRACLRCFQLDYRYEGNKQGVPERIIDMALNGSGVRDISRVLEVSTTTVIAHLKKTKTRRRQPLADSSTRGSV